ncbi:MAG: carbohydrate porin [Phycisphaerales bacterium]|nr:carbohydrate porin [Phycisphaerales bacterium]
MFARDRLLGSWWGTRSFLEDNGLTFNLTLTTVYQHNAHGGLQTKNAHKITGSYGLELTLDLGAMKLIDGGTVYALAEGGWSDGVDEYVGSLFGVNGEAFGDEEVVLSELWYEQKILGEALRVRGGKIDLTVDFDTNAYANDSVTQFLNNGLANTANIPFPEPGHGVQLVATPCPWFYFAAGGADADAENVRAGFDTAYHGPDNFFSIYEFGVTPTLETAWGKLPGAYRVGMWHDPRAKEKFFNDRFGYRLSVPLKRDDVGFYAGFDQAVFRENPADSSDEQGLGVFARYGYAHSDVNEIENFWSVGWQYLGLIPTRDEDTLGFGVASGILSDKLTRIGRDPHHETVLETYYRMQILPWLSVSPDFQWILRPDGENGRDAFVAGFRVQMSF